MEKADRFLRLTLELDPLLPGKEIAVAWLSGCGFSMFEEEATGVVAYARESEWNEASMEEVLEEIKGVASLKVEMDFVASENWNAQWEEAYEPIDVDGLIMMRAPFHPAPTQGIDVIIQPEMSFGTGHHPTTWQMMRALFDLDVSGKSVLDVGCGTGVLAIAAKKMGAGDVVAFDLDEWSFENTLANCERNALEGDIHVLHGTVGQLESELGAYELILANINLNVLKEEMGKYVRCLDQNGTIVFSGFYTSDVAALRQSAEECGLTFVRMTSREDWACALFVKQG